MPGIEPGRGEMGYDEIRRLLPQQEPFIFLDKVLELEKTKRILCLKNISGNDPWFGGHFPSYAVLPGALACEAIAQASIILVMKSYPGLERKIGMFSSIKGRFMRPIVPGDQLLVESRIEKMYPNAPVPAGLVHGMVRIGPDTIITVHLAFGMIDPFGLIEKTPELK